MIVYNKDVIVNDAVVIEEHTSLRYNLSRGKYHLFREQLLNDRNFLIFFECR